jgi:hypothetical protein
MLSAEDTLEIMQFIARYANALDMGDAETWTFDVFVRQR